MAPALPRAAWWQPRLIARLGAGLAALAITLMALTMAAPATADAVDDPPAEETAEEYDFRFSGVIRYQDKPLEGVRMTISGGGFSAETVTDADGRWRIGVPEKIAYTLTVDETTLPEGVIVEGESASQEVEFGLTGTKVINLFLDRGERIRTSFFDQFAQRFINGLNFGLLLALAAMGISLIFGTTGLSNFSHAEMVTFGSVTALVFGVFLDVPMYLTIPIVILLGLALGWTLDVGIWKPLRTRGLGIVQLMIVSIGLSLAARYVIQFFIGGSTYQLPGAGGNRIKLFGPVSLAPIDLASMGLSIVVIIAVAYWLTRTRTGKATRAISDNPSLAAASGINVDQVVRLVWMLSASLASLAGVLWAYFRPGVRWDMGTQILLLIFAAVVLGGLGTAFGALIGALIVGILVEISTLWLPSDLKYVGALLVLIIILLFRPQGILGRRERIG